MAHKPNYFSQKIEITKANVFLLIGLFLLIGGIATYFLFKNKFENEFSSYEGYMSKLGEFPVEDAKDMVKYYNETAPTTSAQGSPIFNPKAVYFELGAIARYMLKVRMLKNATGVRVYFGRYDKKNEREIDGSMFDFKDHSSVIFVPTRKTKEGIIEDILEDEKGNKLLYQPYNGGVSCPPLPPRSCKGQKL